ncbi:hypothetical protein TNCT_538621 [Trichonephila clavata]|uniref:Uncharacterized protein n=1 Tax=Trichonephila clavata TaxID=2740835 RepID=A0A8X6GGS8_TRICU|nr:hypothetical protein TNCT_538621 [Trichonephila clavata]
MGKPSRVHLNARSVGPELCPESFHSTVNVVPRRNECFAKPPPRPYGWVVVTPTPPEHDGSRWIRNALTNPSVAWEKSCVSGTNGAPTRRRDPAVGLS